VVASASVSGELLSEPFLEVLSAAMFERFTERARQVVVIAQEEARALQHNYIGTEHILLGLLRVEEGLAARVLVSLGLTLEKVRAQVVRIVAPSGEVTSGQVPFTPRAKKVLELALREALALGHDYIGTEHILLGLVRDNEGVAMRVMLDFDAGAEKVRNEVIRQLPTSEGPQRIRGTATAKLSDFTFTVSPDDGLRRLLMAAAGHALADQRAEFGLADLLSVAEENRDAPDATGTDPRLQR
jgi:ATP-dependent Clp protease ATP-binding subunit ClpA